MSKDIFRQVSWDDLEAWVGNTTLSRGRSYIKNVSELCFTPKGGLLAWVQGTHRYATLVEVEDDFVSQCSCPVGADCKHAVATVLHYLELLKKKKPVAVAEEDDERFDILEDAGHGDEDLDDDGDDVDARDSVKSSRVTSKRDQSLQDFLAGQDKAKLEGLLFAFAGSHAEIRKALEDQMQASAGASKDLIKQVQRDISQLGNLDWDDDDYGRSSSVDLKRLSFRLKLLLDGGYYDELVGMGQQLLKNGKRLVEESHDEGELGGQVQECMEVILSALPHSSLSKGEGLIWLVEIDLLSDYDLVDFDEKLENFWDEKEEKPTSEDWKVLAKHLQRQLGKDTGRDFSSKYRRDQLSNWLREALENSGQKAEVLRLLEEEAVKTQSYTRLVEELVRRKKFAEADLWIKRGIEVTEKDAPGYASQLRGWWRELREKENDYLQITALSSEDFFLSPSLASFQKLRDDAERAELWQKIEPLARAYLESGKRPNQKELGLPELDLPPQREKRWGTPPFLNVLLDLALAEKKPDEVLHWYDLSNKSRTGYGWGRYDEHGHDRIAEAVKQSHPERAVQIWQSVAENLIAQTSVTNYQIAAQYLRKLKPLMGEAWRTYLAKLREENKRKPRCVEILDGLVGRSILGE